MSTRDGPLEIFKNNKKQKNPYLNGVERDLSLAAAAVYVQNIYARIIIFNDRGHYYTLASWSAVAKKKTTRCLHYGPSTYNIGIIL